MMLGSASPCIDVVEAAYLLEGSEADWLRRVMEAARAELGSEFGIFAHINHVGDGPEVRVGLITTEGPEWQARACIELNTGLSREDVRLAYSDTTLLTLSELRPFATSRMR